MLGGEKFLRSPVEMTSDLLSQTELRKRYAACLGRLRELVISLRGHKKEATFYCFHNMHPGYNAVTRTYIDNLSTHVERSVLQLADASFFPEISEIAEEEQLLLLYELKYRPMIDLATIDMVGLFDGKYNGKGNVVAIVRKYLNLHLTAAQSLMRALDKVSTHPHFVPIAQDVEEKLRNDMAASKERIQAFIDRDISELAQPIPSIDVETLAASFYELCPVALFLFRNVIDKMKVGNLTPIATTPTYELLKSIERGEAPACSQDMLSVTPPAATLH